MTQLVLNITKQGIGGIGETIGLDTEKLAINSVSREMIVLGAILCILQILDGILTGIGIGMFGTAAEGNLMLRLLMEYCGAIPALILAKSFAIMIVGILCLLSNLVVWIPKAMKLVIAVYLLAAVIPWTTILLTGGY